MDYSIESSTDGKYYRIKINVDVTIDLARKWTQELVELTKSSGIKKYLFDSRGSKNIASVSENYKFSYEDASKLNLGRGTRQAILASSDDHSHDFVETTKVNAGYDVKIFTDESEAIKWLEE